MTASIATARCGRCDSEVPAGEFCGVCGSELQEGRIQSASWLRPRAFAAAAGERVLRPHLISSVFPHLPTPSLGPFRIAMAITVVALSAAATARLPAAAIAVGGLAPLLLFVTYLRVSRFSRYFPLSALALAGILGAGLGAGWVLVDSELDARSYAVPISTGLALNHAFGYSLKMAAIGLALMTLPAVAIRLRHTQTRESLDGFVIGVLAGLAFTAGATLTRHYPQLTTGLFTHSRPRKGLLVQALLDGVADPLTAAATAGIVGILLWYTPSARASRDGRIRRVLAVIAVLALLADAAVGVVDMVVLPQVWTLAAHLMLALVAVVLLRSAVQLALLHEDHDRIQGDQSLLCIKCEQVVPDMAFCPACGAATRASSRYSRLERRGRLRPRRVEAPVGELLMAPDGSVEKVYAGADLLPGGYASDPLIAPRWRRLLAQFGGLLAAATVALGLTAAVLSPKVSHYGCPPNCGRPPEGRPVASLPRFQPADGRFSVSYPEPSEVYTVTTENDAVTATLTIGDGGVLQLFSEPAGGRSARDIAKALITKTHPDAKTDYEIPNAMVGWQPGYGELADDWPQTTTTSTRERVLIMVAVKNDLALVAFATGPFHRFGPDFGPGPPSGANLQLAQDMSKYVNSFRWRGDPPR